MTDRQNPYLDQPGKLSQVWYAGYVAARSEYRAKYAPVVKALREWAEFLREDVVDLEGASQLSGMLRRTSDALAALEEDNAKEPQS